MSNMKKEFNVGGSIERALSGQYELKVFTILQEACVLTFKNFLSFSPAIIALFLLQIGVFLGSLKLQYGFLPLFYQKLNLLLLDPNAAISEEAIELISSINLAVFSFELISAPIYAGVCLMAIHHAVGLKTRFHFITNGLRFTIPIIFVTAFSLLLQALFSEIIALLSFYISIVLSASTLLICEKRVPPLQSLLLSFQATNKKLLPITTLYFIMTMMFILALLFYGVGLPIVLPFIFHVKAILYREMFGIRLQLVAMKSPSDHDDKNDEGDSAKTIKMFDA